MRQCAGIADISAAFRSMRTLALLRTMSMAHGIQTGSDQSSRAIMHLKATGCFWRPRLAMIWCGSSGGAWLRMGFRRWLALEGLRTLVAPGGMVALKEEKGFDRLSPNGWGLARDFGWRLLSWSTGIRGGTGRVQFSKGRHHAGAQCSGHAQGIEMFGH